MRTSTLGTKPGAGKNRFENRFDRFGGAAAKSGLVTRVAQVRTVAVLDWGPTNLSFHHPRAKLKLRTEFLPNGPELPSFLTCREEQNFPDARPVARRFAFSYFQVLLVCFVLNLNFWLAESFLKGS